VHSRSLELSSSLRDCAEDGNPTASEQKSGRKNQLSRRERGLRKRGFLLELRLGRRFHEDEDEKWNSQLLDGLLDGDMDLLLDDLREEESNRRRGRRKDQEPRFCLDEATFKTRNSLEEAMRRTGGTHPSLVAAEVSLSRVLQRESRRRR